MSLPSNLNIKILVSCIAVSFIIFKKNDCFSQDLPKVIQPSPDASALFRYQDYPMDYSTGLPQISIPIYEVKSGSLSVPISISYHAAPLLRGMAKKLTNSNN